MMLLSLPGILRAAGLTVTEVNGWRTRGADDWGPLAGITLHHTGGNPRSTDAGEVRTLLTGSATAPAPIAQLYLSRSGRWFVVAAGRCNHNLDGWGGPNAGLGNSRLLGIEAQHSGGAELWTAVQYQSYVRGVAALCIGLHIPAARVAGHKEHQPGDKQDPTFNCATFRARVAALITHGLGSDVNLSDEIYRDDDGAVRNVKNILGSLDVRTRRTESTVNSLAKTVGNLVKTVDAIAKKDG